MSFILIYHVNDFVAKRSHGSAKIEAPEPCFFSFLLMYHVDNSLAKKSYDSP